MKFKKKIFISLILVLSIFMLNSAPVFSAEVKDIDIDAQSNVDAISDSDVTNITTDVATLNIHSLNKNECMIAEYVNANEFNKSSHVSRLSDEEKLDTYVFLNADGTKSVYYMDEKVKFVDKNGDVKEKDISLVSKSDGYGITRNEFDLHLPTSASSGITMSYNGYDVKIIPQTTVKAVPAKIENGSVVYDGFFGADTRLKYTPTLSGVKEDVIMKAYIPNASFSFILDTDGLGVYNKDGEYYLAENESSKAVLNLGKVIIYDAMGKPEYGTITVETITENQRYRLSLSAPEDFLKDPNTVYPVTIDPTLTVSDNDTGNGSIQDAVLYSNRPDINYGGISRYLHIGYVDSTYGVGRVAVKLPGLYNSAEYINIDSSCITSVKFYCWDNSDNPAQQVNLYRLATPWGEDAVNGGMSMTYYSTPNMGTTMSSDTWTAFDITALVKTWKTVALAPPGLGFILVNSNESSSANMKKICSSEFSNPDLRPYVVMRYVSYIPNGTYIIENAKTSKNIDIENQAMANGTTIHQWDYHGESTQQWIISYHSDIHYTIKSAKNPSYYLSAQNDDSGDAAIVLKSGTVTNGMKWEIIKISGNRYKIISKSGTANNKALSLSSATSAANGNDIVQKTYTADNNNEDEWILYCISDMPTVNLDLIYDGAYQTRYSDAQDRITSHASAVRKVYMKSFGVWVNYSDPAQFVSYADANCYSDPTRACDHATNTNCFNSFRANGEITLKDLHHKNYMNIWLRIPMPDLTQSVKASFIGHNCCKVNRDSNGNYISHGSSGVNGSAYKDAGSCIITNFVSAESERKTLLHEFGHFYGVKDHYGIGDVLSTDEMNSQGEGMFSRYCIYGEEREDNSVLTNMTICEGCQRTICENMNKFDHE